MELMTGAMLAAMEVMNGTYEWDRWMGSGFCLQLCVTATFPCCTHCPSSKQRCLLIFCALLCRCRALVHRKKALNQSGRRLAAQLLKPKAPLPNRLLIPH